MEVLFHPKRKIGVILFFICILILYVGVWSYGQQTELVRQPSDLPDKNSVNRLSHKTVYPTDVSSDSAETGRPVKTILVQKGYTQRIRRYSGLVNADRYSDLAFRVSGPLTEVLVKPGDSVKAGDILMRIDPRDFQNNVAATENSLEAARARLKMMKTGQRTEDIKILEAKIESARARVTYSQTEVKRATRLVDTLAISHSEFDLMLSTLKMDQAALTSLEQELIKAQTGSRTEEIQAAEAEIKGLEVKLRMQKNTLEDTCLRAPYNGTVTTQHYENYEMVTAGSPAFSMVDISKLEIEVWLPERELITRVKTNQKEKGTAIITFPSAPEKKFKAVFKKVNATANPQTRTWSVIFSMDAPDDLVILPGMSADVFLESCDSSADKEIITIPASAVFSDNTGGSYVWCVTPQWHAKRQAIIQGRILDSDHMQIISGLNEGQRIVTAGIPFITEGMMLREGI